MGQVASADESLPKLLFRRDEGLEFIVKTPSEQEVGADTFSKPHAVALISYVSSS